MREYGRVSLGIRLAGHKVKSAHTLAIEAKVLGEGLRHKHVQIRVLFEEVADGPGIFCDAAGRKALVGHVEEREDSLTFADLRNNLPLLLCRVETSGIVGTGG